MAGKPDEAQRRLFVTLSNLTFLPAILMALSWQHFHLSIIYMFTMTCSMLYHWCDSSPLWPSANDCVLPYDTLQFADFFAAGVSAWTTLLAMAVIGQRLRLVCLTIAFLTFAVAVHCSRFHIATFAIPLAIAAVVVISSWVYRCRRFNVIYPPNEGLIRLSVGICLTVTAACLYLYFQEGASYEYVHGAWHIIVQLSACFLLPKPIVNDANKSPAVDINGDSSNSTSFISSDAQLLATMRRKSWLAVNFPLFDVAFWRLLGKRAFWRSQFDDCCGVIDHTGTAASSSSPILSSPSRSNNNAHQEQPTMSPLMNSNNNANVVMTADQTSSIG